jgi:uncharacterized protein YciI
MQIPQGALRLHAVTPEACTMKSTPIAALSLAFALAMPIHARAQESAVAPPVPAFDAELAKRLGADERGMRSYVLVVLKTGPTRVPDGPAREAMFAGHFANMERLAKAGKLALAGPFAKDPDGWRGLFVFAVADIEEARQLVATDPVIVNGEMVAEYHRWYGSAAVMIVPEVHDKVAPKGG